MTDATPADGGFLSFDDAVAALTPAVEADTPETEDAAPEGEAPVEPEGEESEAATVAEDPEGEADEPGDDGEQAEEEARAVAPVDPPQWWKAEAKAKFAELPPDLQAVVREQEDVRERVVAEAKAQAAEVVKAAQKEVEGVQALAEKLNDFLPQAVARFGARWGDNPDWDAVAEQYGEVQAEAFKNQWNAEQIVLFRLREENERIQSLAEKARKDAEEAAKKAFLEEESAKLAKLAPDLADPIKGREIAESLAKYAVSIGYDMSIFDGNASALDITVLNKARLWDEAQAKLPALAQKTKPAANPAKSPVRPGAATAAMTQQRAKQQLKNRFAQTRSIEDAIALLT